ncbi:MAG: GNAT family N-acetyltransferase [Planctomycetaceae bacterium]|jgi:ribosomal protein S18 acetylase RimI-like enzyme|nr:GNAT family N-acetyltransferase [Planctomycetaceae bacterium]
MSSPIVYADWDSRFFGFPIGNFEVPENCSKETLEDILREAHTKFRLVSVTLSGEGPDTLPVSAAVCPCYARQLHFKKQYSKEQSGTEPHGCEVNPNVRPYTSAFCTPALERLAVQSGTFSRFRQDPELSPRYEQLFLVWIHNAVSKELADGIWTWVDNGQHAGLVTIRCAKRTNPHTGEVEREGRIGMLSVDSKHRGQGIGQHLLEACDFWCHSLDIPVSAVITQKENQPVRSLCEKLGFQIDSESSVYHYWTPGWIYDAHRGWLIQ